MSDCLYHRDCSCNVCVKGTAEKLIKSLPSSPEESNQMWEFVKQFPAGFPLGIRATTFADSSHPLGNTTYRSLVGNDNVHSKKTQKPSTVITRCKKITNNLSAKLYVTIYYTHRAQIVNKYDVTTYIEKLQPSEKKNLRYLQAYRSQPYTHVQYCSTKFLTEMDSVLLEHIEYEVSCVAKCAQLGEGWTASLTHDFHLWVARDYGIDTFLMYMTGLYSRIYELLSRHHIEKGDFYWDLQNHSETDSLSSIRRKTNTKTERAGSFNNSLLSPLKPLQYTIKLCNVQSMQIKYFRKLQTFQEEYHNIVLSKVSSVPQEQLTFVKKHGSYPNRLYRFKNRAQGIFKEQQASLITSIFQQQSHMSEKDSDTLARLFLPLMGEQHRLRDVLKDPQAARKILLGVAAQHKAQSPFPKSESTEPSSPKRRKLSIRIPARKRQLIRQNTSY